MTWGPTARGGGVALMFLALLVLVVKIGASLAANPVYHRQPRTVLVSSSQELQRALIGADIIRLRQGSYPPMAIRGVQAAHAITITSADPSHPAVLTALSLIDSHNIVLRDLTFGDPGAGVQYSLLVQNSSGITIDHLSFTPPAAVARSVVSAIFVRKSSDIEIADSFFTRHWHGISFLDVDNMRVRDNEFTDLQTDGIRGGGVSNFEVTRNVLASFHPAPGDHPDGIQLWSTNETIPGRHIRIEGNIVARGSGSPTQGIFIRDTFGHLPFEDVTIRGNLIIGSMYNGIAVNGVRGLHIEDNEVVALPDAKSWIRIDKGADVEMKRNRAMLFLVEGRAVADPFANERTTPADGPIGPLLRAWLARHRDYDHPGPVLRSLLAS